MTPIDNSFAAFAADILSESIAPSFGCLMAFVDSALSAQVTEWAFDNIDQEDVIEDEKEPHVTILYGFHPDVAHEEIFELVKDYGPIEVTLGKISKFKQEDQDVIKIDVESEDLRELNALMREKFAERYTNKYPDYKPHMTLAYVAKDGGGDIEIDAFEGEVLTLPILVYSYAEMKQREKMNLDKDSTVTEAKQLKPKIAYTVANVFVNGKRVSGEISAYSPKAAVSGIVYRYLTPSQRSNIGQYVMRANELGGYKVSEAGKQTIDKQVDKPKYWWDESVV